jgi:methionyl-tRNA formyltransferase
LRIAICVKQDLAGNLALNRLVRTLAGRHEIHVILSDHVLTAERANPLAACLLEHERDMPLECIFPWLDEQFPRGCPDAYQTVSGLAATYGISFELWGRARTPQTITNMRRLAPDLIISCRYDYIFPDEIIRIPRLGAYGLHPGLLPQIQGLCGPFRAMQMRHARTGCTLFHIDEGIDSGAVVDIGWNDIDYSRSLLWNFVGTYFAGIDVLNRHLPILEQGKRLPGVVQNSAERQYYCYPSEDEFRTFLGADGALVDLRDYLELLSLYLPKGMQDQRMKELRMLVTNGNC